MVLKKKMVLLHQQYKGNNNAYKLCELILNRKRIVHLSSQIKFHTQHYIICLHPLFLWLRIRMCCPYNTQACVISHRTWQVATSNQRKQSANGKRQQFPWTKRQPAAHGAHWERERGRNQDREREREREGGWSTSKEKWFHFGRRVREYVASGSEVAYFWENRRITFSEQVLKRQIERLLFYGLFIRQGREYMVRSRLPICICVFLNSGITKIYCLLFIAFKTYLAFGFYLLL